MASVGTTGTTAVDPLAQIIPLARQYGMWVHVDAAMAGSALLLPEMRWLADGVEGADSLAWNPHKWLGTVLDCSLLYVADPDHLIRVMSTNPSYLRSAVDGEVTQYKDWGIPLGRRFRALKLWFHLRLDGAEAIRARLRRDLDNARWLAEQVSSTPGWRVLAPVNLQTVVLRHEPAGVVRAVVKGTIWPCAPWHSGGMQSVYEAAGGSEGLLRLAEAWHSRVMADEVVSHAFSHGFHPQHNERLAAYWAEALGGPARYSGTYGDETSVVRIHSGNGPHEEMDRRAIACFDQAMHDVGLQTAEPLRQVLHDYFAWATTTTMSRYHESADDVPEGMSIPRWSWGGLQR